MAGIQCFTPPKCGTVGQAMRAMGTMAFSSRSHSVGSETDVALPRQAATIRPPACATPPSIATRIAAGTVSAVMTKG
jgi:hypothetical protein